MKITITMSYEDTQPLIEICDNTADLVNLLDYYLNQYELSDGYRYTITITGVPKQAPWGHRPLLKPNLGDNMKGILAFTKAFTIRLLFKPKIEVIVVSEALRNDIILCMSILESRVMYSDAENWVYWMRRMSEGSDQAWRLMKKAERIASLLR